MVSEYYKKLALKIPAKIRDEQLLTVTDPINSAVASHADPYMKLLAKIWFTFIEPTATPDYSCGRCLANVINNYKELLPALKEVKRDFELLNSL